jgi:hypothetical protein
MIFPVQLINLEAKKLRGSGLLYRLIPVVYILVKGLLLVTNLTEYLDFAFLAGVGHSWTYSISYLFMARICVNIKIHVSLHITWFTEV